MNKIGRVCIAGRFPPPIGGVSNYIKRRYSLLVKDGTDPICLDFSHKSWLFEFFITHVDLYEVHTLNVWIIALFYLSGRIRQTIFFDHNASRNLRGIRKNLVFKMLSKSKKVCVVNKDLKGKYPEGIKLEVVIPFLPPELNEKATILASYPKELFEFINRGPFLINSAWRYIVEDGVDLYGIDTSLFILEAISEYNMVLAIPDYNEADMPEELIEDISALTTQGRLFLLTGQRELWPLFSQAVAFLRLTSTDGDSVSVREALYFGCNVIASDVVTRPPGTITYHYKSWEDLYRKIISVL